MGDVIPYSRVKVPHQRRAEAEAIAAFGERLVAEIDYLIELVDEIDGDPDFEPSLGWTRTMAIGDTTDREEDHAF